MNLTGKTRYRPVVYELHGHSTQVLLVLQVEYTNYDTDMSPAPTLWRDAQVEDLPTLDSSEKETTC